MNPRGQRIGKAADRIKRAEAAMEAVLAKEWPVGTTVRFYLMHGQVNPSSGQVIGHTGGRYAYLRVRVESRKQVVRDVSAKDVW